MIYTQICNILGEGEENLKISTFEFEEFQSYRNSGWLLPRRPILEPFLQLILSTDYLQGPMFFMDSSLDLQENQKEKARVAT